MSFELGPRAVAELREIARRVLREEIAYGPIGRYPQENQPWAAIMKTSTGGITGRSSNTPGSGTATIYCRSTGNSLTQLSTTTITIYNASTNSVGVGGKWIQAKQDVWGTKWVDVEYCT